MVHPYTTNTAGFSAGTAMEGRRGAFEAGGTVLSTCFTRDPDPRPSPPPQTKGKGINRLAKTCKGNEKLLKLGTDINIWDYNSNLEDL